jgi:hypothetical protein
MNENCSTGKPASANSGSNSGQRLLDSTDSAFIELSATEVLVTGAASISTAGATLEGVVSVAISTRTGCISAGSPNVTLKLKEVKE